MLEWLLKISNANKESTESKELIEKVACKVMGRKGQQIIIKG